MRLANREREEISSSDIRIWGIENDGKEITDGRERSSRGGRGTINVGENITCRGSRHA